MQMISVIKEGIKDMFFIGYKEMKSIKKDLGVIIFFVVVPLIYPVVYGFIYNTETVHEVPLAVVDLSGSVDSRDLIRKIDSSPDVRMVSLCADMEEARVLLNEKKAYGILYIPARFTKDLQNGKQTSVSLYCDMGSMLNYKAFLTVITEATMDLGKNIQLTKMAGVTAQEENIITVSVPYESVSLYNTQNGFASFLVPAILVLVIQQTLLLGVGMLAATAREKNYAGQPIPADSHHSGIFRIVLGRSMAYFLIYIPVCIWSFQIVPYLFDLPRIASVGTLVLFVLPYLLACVFFAMIVSNFVKERESPMLLIVFTSLPLLFISGVSWPTSAIPPFWKWLGYVAPSTMGIQGFIKINSMGAGLAEVAHEYKALWIQSGIYFIIACLIYRRQLIKSEKIRKARLEEIRSRR